MIVFEHNLSELPLVSRSKLEVSVGPVGEDDFFKFAKSFKIDHVAEERFEKGHLCFGASFNDEYIHLTWVAFDRHTRNWSFNHSHLPINFSIKLSFDSAYIYGIVTLPKYRGLGISPAVLKETLRYLSTMGLKKAYSMAFCDNLSSLRVHEKVQARKIGVITFFKMFRWEGCWLNSETEEDYNTLRQMFHHSGKYEVLVH